MNAETRAYIDKAVKDRWASIGPIFTPGATTPVGNAKPVTPGLITIEFPEAGFLPIAVTSRSLVRRVLAADVNNIPSGGVLLGWNVPVLAGEKWTLRAMLYLNSAAGNVGGVHITITKPAGSLQLLGIGQGNSLTQCVQIGSPLHPAQNDVGPFGTFDTSGQVGNCGISVDAYFAPTADGNIDIGIYATTVGNLFKCGAGSSLVAHRVA